MQILSTLLLVLLIGALLCLVLDRWINPWIIRRQSARMIADVKAGKLPKCVDCSHSISFDSSGFTVTALKDPQQQSITTFWTMVQNVKAFKRDLWNVDCICLYFSTSAESGVETNEDMAGWGQFIDQLPQHLSGCKKTSAWIWDVSTPAFAKNLTEIFSR